jgi:hypothetical protein
MADSLQEVRLIEEVRIIAGLAHAFSVHLRECWPLKGGVSPVAGPPTNSTSSDLSRFLLDLKTLLVHFTPTAGAQDGLAPGDPVTTILALPAVGDALGRISLSCDRLADQFGLQAVFASVVDGNRKVLLGPTLNAARYWEPLQGLPFPEIDPGDIRSLSWAAATLFRALGETPPQDCLAEVTKEDLRIDAPPDAGRDAPNAQPQIVWHKDRLYSLNDRDPVLVTETEHMVLQAFLGSPPQPPALPAMDKPTLIKRSGVGHAPKVLSKLLTKYDACFAPAIRTPKGQKSSGGYVVNIRAADRNPT